MFRGHTCIATGLGPVHSVSAFHTRETAHRAVATAVSATGLPAGSAKGSLTYDGATAELKFAAAFIDQKDESKPIVIVISDQKLPVEKWKSEFDMMDHSEWSGVVFFLDKDEKFSRSDVHMKGRQSSVSGIFELKIDPRRVREGSQLIQLAGRPATWRFLARTGSSILLK